MKKSLLFILALVMIPMLTQAQDEEGNWTREGNFASSDSSIMGGAHAVTVDGEGKVWFADFYALDPWTEDSTVNVSNLYVYNEDGTAADFSPIQHVIIGEDTTNFARAAAGRGITGLATNADGDVVLAINNMMIRIDHTTGAGLNVTLPEVDAEPRLAGPAADALGNIYITGVVGGPIKMYSAELDTSESNGTVLIPTTSGVHRDVAVARDGNGLYLANNGALVAYTRPNEFGEWSAADTLHAVGTYEAVEVDPYSGNLWFSLVLGDDEFHNIYEMDLETGELVDSVQWIADEGFVAANQLPRDIAFGNLGNDMYVAAMRNSGDNFFPVQKFTRVEAVSTEPISELPSGYTLKQNYPNPFNPTTNIEFTLKEAGHVTLKVYDMTGREVATLVNSNMNTGPHIATFDASNLASGVYIYQLQANGVRLTNRMTLIK